MLCCSLHVSKLHKWYHTAHTILPLAVFPTQHHVFKVYLYKYKHSLSFCFEVCLGCSQMTFRCYTGVKCPSYCPKAQTHSHTTADTEYRVQNTELHPWSPPDHLPRPTVLCSPYILEPQRFRANSASGCEEGGLRGKGFSSRTEG